VEVLSQKYMELDPPRVDTARHNWLLDQSRLFTRAAITLAGFFKLTGDEKYAQRAWLFVEDAMGWDSWYLKGDPGSEGFDLSTGELAFAFPVILDWLGDWLDRDKRVQIISKLQERIIIPYLSLTTGEASNKVPWWYRSETNWNSVCNGGLLCLAHYLSNEDQNARKAVEMGSKGLNVFINHLHPDGTNEEGVGYWMYGIMFLVYALLSFEKAQGKEHAAFSLDGVKNGLKFYFDFTLANGHLSFSDVGETCIVGILYALAARTGQKSMVREITKRFMEKKEVLQDPPAYNFDRSYWVQWPSEIFALLCCPEYETDHETAEEDLKRFTVYPDNGWGVFYSSDIRLTLRSGSTRVNHAMHDLNSIQMAKAGVCLLEDTRANPYPLGWFGPSRELYFENMTQGKNSMLVNGIGQIKYEDAVWGNDEQSMWSDASPAYPPFVKKVERKVSLAEGGIDLEDVFITEGDAWHEIRFITTGQFIEEGPGRWRVEKDNVSAVLEFECDHQLFCAAYDAPASVGVRPMARMLRVLTEKPCKSSVIKTRIR
jgi:hypothetical protein